MEKSRIFLSIVVCLFVSSLITQGQTRQQLNLEYDQKSEATFILRDDPSDNIAGSIDLQLQLLSKNGKDHLVLGFMVPHSLARGYEQIMLFRLGGSRDELLKHIRDETRTRINVRAGAVARIERFFDTPDNQLLLDLVTPMRGGFARFNDKFSAEFMINNPVSSFTLELRLYYGGRNDFSGAFYPLVLDLTLPQLARAVPVVPENERPVSIQDQTVVAAAQPHQTPESQQVKESVTRETVETVAAKQVLQPMPGLQAEDQSAMLTQAEDILERCKLLYSRVQEHYSDNQEEPSKDNLSQPFRQEALQLKTQFDQIMTGLVVQNQTKRRELNEFYDYYFGIMDRVGSDGGEQATAAASQKDGDTTSGKDNASGRKTIRYLLLGLLALVIVVAGVVLLMRWQQKMQRLKIQNEIKRKARIEMNKQTFQVRKQQNKLRI